MTSSWWQLRAVQVTAVLSRPIKEKYRVEPDFIPYSHSDLDRETALQADWRHSRGYHGRIHVPVAFPVPVWLHFGAFCPGWFPNEFHSRFLIVTYAKPVVKCFPDHWQNLEQFWVPLTEFVLTSRREDIDHYFQSHRTPPIYECTVPCCSSNRLYLVHNRSRNQSVNKLNLCIFCASSRGKSIKLCLLTFRLIS